MLIKELELKNFLGTRKISNKDGIYKIEFPTFKNQIILIKGENGYGKSTILENLTPYSSMIKRDIKNSIVYPAHKKITILKEEKEYRLEIYFEDEKTKKGYIYINNEPMEETKKGNITEFDYQVDKIFGKFEKFKSSVFLKQGSTEIIDAKPTERLNIINKFMPALEIYDKSKTISSDKEKEYKEKNILLKKRLGNIEEFSFKYERNKEQEKEFSQEIIDEYNEKKDKLQKEKEEFIKITQKKDFLLKDIKERENENEKIVIEEGVEEKLKENEKLLTVIDEKDFYKKKEEINLISEILENIKEKEGEILKHSKEEIDKCEKEILELESREIEVTKENQNIINKEKELKNITQEIKEIEVLDEKILIEKCEKCENELKELKIENMNLKLCDSFIEEMIQLSQTIKITKTKIFDKEYFLEEKEKELKELKELINKNISNEQRLKSLNENIKNCDEKIIETKKITKELPQKEEEIIKTSKELKNIDIQVTEKLNEKLKVFNKLLETIEINKYEDINYQEKLENCEKELEEVKKIEITQSVKKTQIETLKKNIKEIEKEITSKEEKEEKELIENLERTKKEVYRIELSKKCIENSQTQHKCPTCQKDLTNEEIQKIKEEIKTLDKLKEDVINIERLIQDCEKRKQITIIEKEIKSLEEEISKNNNSSKQIEEEIKEIEKIIREKSIIEKELENLNEFEILKFETTDIQNSKKIYKTLNEETQESLKKEKETLQKIEELKNEIQIIKKDEEKIKGLEEEKEKILKEIEKIEIIQVTKDEKELVEEIEKIKSYQEDEKTIKREIEKIKKYNTFLNNFDYTDLDKLYEEYKLIFYSQRKKIDEEKKNIKEREILNVNLTMFKKECEINKKNILRKNELEKSEKEILEILNKPRIIFSKEDLNKKRQELKNINENNNFLEILEKMLLKLEYTKELLQYEKLREEIVLKKEELKKVILEINEKREINEKTQIEIEKLKKRIQENIHNQTKIIENKEKIIKHKEELETLHTEFNHEDHEKFMEEYNIFNEKLKTFLIDKIDLERKFNEYKELEEEIKQNEREEFQWNKLKNYSIKIKKAIISETFSEITQIANEIIKNEGTIGSLRLEINQINDKKFEIKAKDIEREGYEISDISLLSGAEQMSVVKGISFALSKKTEHKLLYLDESDGVLSPKNKHTFPQMLKNLFNILDLDEIFVISHQKEVEETVDHVIEIGTSS